jgi:hypothetical protein
MTQRLTIHIGAIKTGSSAIQMFLNRNNGVLRREGIIVPDEDMKLAKPVTGDHVFFFDRFQAKDPTAAEGEVMERLSELFNVAGTRQVVLSAENLAEASGVCAAWFESAATRYDTEVVVYLRRQDDLLVSAWQQWYAKVRDDVWDDFWSWLITCVGTLGDWRAVLEHWERVVGRERMRVRLYEPRHMIEADAVADFRQFLVTDAADLVNVDQKINPSFTEAIVDLIPGAGLFRDSHDDGFYRFLERLLGEASLRRPDESPLTYRQRLALLTRYAESNRWVRANYFDGTDLPEDLFETPRSEQYRTLSREELTREQLQLMGRLVFELSKEEFRRKVIGTDDVIAEDDEERP